MIMARRPAGRAAIPQETLRTGSGRHHLRLRRSTLVNRPTVHDLRRPPWLAAGLVAVLASGLVAASDSPAQGLSQTTVLRGDVTATAGAAGTVQSADTRDLVFGTAGTVTKVEVTPGTKVKSGQVLARLDDADAKGQVDVAKAALAAADDTYAKAQEGICSGGGGG